jgi:hypothetical protein
VMRPSLAVPPKAVAQRRTTARRSLSPPAARSSARQASTPPDWSGWAGFDLPTRTGESLEIAALVRVVLVVRVKARSVREELTVFLVPFSRRRRKVVWREIFCRSDFGTRTTRPTRTSIEIAGFFNTPTRTKLGPGTLPTRTSGLLPPKSCWSCRPKQPVGETCHPVAFTHRPAPRWLATRARPR